MRIIGFNFDKINVEKLSNKIENLKINSNVNISELKEIKSEIFKGEETIINVKFSYNLNYDPNFAKIDFIGNIIFSIKPEKAKEILKQWENKKIVEDFKVVLFNLILKKTTLKALQLEDELNLPLHIQLPSLKFDNEKNK
jgi:hypothetical protein